MEGKKRWGGAVNQKEKDEESVTEMKNSKKIRGNLSWFQEEEVIENERE